MVKKFKDAKVGDTIYGVKFKDFSSNYNNDGSKTSGVLTFDVIEYTVTKVYFPREWCVEIKVEPLKIITQPGVNPVTRHPYLDIEFSPYSCEISPNTEDDVCYFKDTSFFTSIEGLQQYLHILQNDITMANEKIQEALSVYGN